ncbi:hypothetical protein [Actinophytocola sp.]|uniref:hypothetical protein n=1 Tax=Actinophytocola sp. TaxID=1872138 RepID=UPI002D52EA2A|nr:hypothetical protein [Actinophytocola sp.]HYQ64510.1 hypothetical protein [Actinophytocola sp.]
MATIVTAAVGVTTLLPGVASAAPPDNDAFAGATPLTTVPAAAEVALAETTAEPGEPNPSCGSSSGAPSAWFAFTAPRTESITLARTSFEWDTVQAVYTGDSLDADLAEGTVVFKAVAEPGGVRDALPSDNTVIAPATTVRPATSR